MSTALSEKRDTIVGALVRFWVWVDCNTKGEEVPVEIDRKFIDALVDLDGFVAAMIAAGWLESALPETASNRDDGPYRIPKRAKFMPETTGNEKAQHAEYMRKYRAQDGPPVKKVKKETVKKKRTSPVKSEAALNERRRRDWVRAVTAMSLCGELHCKEFQAVWEEWSDFRSIEKRVRLGPKAIPRQIRMLEEMGLKSAIATIEHSIQNSYTGLFPPKEVKAKMDDWRDGSARVRPEKEKY